VEVTLSDGQTLACQTAQQESTTCVTIPWQRLEFPDL